MQGSVDLIIENGVATITFFHPAHNSLPGDILSKLAETILEAGAYETVRVIVLKSGGDRTFCAGASFDELIAVDSEESGKAFFSGFSGVINACRSCGKIIIGRVQGKAVGGGVGVAAASDYCMATRFASVRLSELAIGIGPFVIGPAVERKVGTSAFAQMAIDPARWYDAEWARQKGLYAEVFDSAEEMDTRIHAFAEELAGYNPAALEQLKSVFWEGTDHWNELLDERAAMSGRMVLSEFTRNAIEAFKQKS